VIQSVQPDSPAAEAGLQRGDVIHRINRMPVTNRQDLVRAMASLKGEKEIVMQIERNGQLLFVSVSLD
jgi:serine protease Do